MIGLLISTLLHLLPWVGVSGNLSTFSYLPLPFFLFLEHIIDVDLIHPWRGLISTYLV